jgi:hypothetical protein
LLQIHVHQTQCATSDSTASLATVHLGSQEIHFQIVTPLSHALNAHLTLNAHKTKHVSMKDASIPASLTILVLHKQDALPGRITQCVPVRKDMVAIRTDNVTDRNVEWIMTVL